MLEKIYELISVLVERNIEVIKTCGTLNEPRLKEIYDLVNQYSTKELMDKLNLNKAVVRRWKSGQYMPGEPRLHKTVETLRNTAEM